MCPSGRWARRIDVQLVGEAGAETASAVPRTRPERRASRRALALGRAASSAARRRRAGTSSNFMGRASDEDPRSQSWCIPKKAEREFTININPELPGSTTRSASKHWTAEPVEVSSGSRRPFSLQMTLEPAGREANATGRSSSGALPAGVNRDATSGLISGDADDSRHVPVHGQRRAHADHAENPACSDDEDASRSTSSGRSRASRAADAADQVRGRRRVRAEADGRPEATAGRTRGRVASGTLPTGADIRRPTTARSAARRGAAGIFALQRATATDGEAASATYEGRITVAAKLTVVARRCEAGAASGSSIA